SRSGGGSAITAKKGRLAPGARRRSALAVCSARLSFSASAAPRNAYTSSGLGSAPASASALPSGWLSATSSATTRTGPCARLLRFSTWPRTKNTGLPEAVSYSPLTTRVATTSEPVEKPSQPGEPSSESAAAMTTTSASAAPVNPVSALETSSRRVDGGGSAGCLKIDSYFFGAAASAATVSVFAIRRGP